MRAMKGTRLQFVAVIAFIGVGWASIIGLHVVMTRPADPNAPKQDWLQGFMTLLGKDVLTSTESDVVVLVRSSGSLLVLSKRRPEPISLASIGDLRAALRTLPRADSATVLVADGSPGSLGIGESPTSQAELSEAEVQITRILQEAGIRLVTRERGWDSRVPSGR